MLCMICKQNDAKVHLTQIVGDKMQKVDLCEECAKTKGVNDPTGFSLADLLLGLGASQEIEQAAGGAELKCGRCGFTQAPRGLSPGGLLQTFQIRENVPGLVAAHLRVHHERNPVGALRVDQ